MRLQNVHQVWWYNASTLPRRELPPISLLRSTRGRRTAVQHTEGRQKRRRLNACGCNLFSQTVTSPRTIPCLNHTSMYGTYRQATSSRQKPTPSQRPRGAHAFPERAVLDGHACGQPGGEAAEQLHGSSRLTQTLQSYTFYLCSPPPAQTVRLSGGGVGDQFPEAVKSGSVSGVGGRRAGRSATSGRTPTGHRQRGDFPSLDIGCASTCQTCDRASGSRVSNRHQSCGEAAIS